MVDQLYEGNRAFRENDLGPNRAFYEALAKGQKPEVLWIGCLDSRITPERITSAKAGELFVHRNIGNTVPPLDLNAGTVIEYAINHLKVKEIVVCGHSDCGACKALDADLPNDHMIPIWLGNLMPAKKRVDSTLAPATSEGEKAARLEAIIKENVRLQLEHLRQFPLVSQAEADGRIRLYGVYFDIASGELTPVD
jgi:carbonic anhydrase